MARMMRKSLFYRLSVSFSLLVINIAVFVADVLGVDKSIATVMLSITLSCSFFGLYFLTEKDVARLPVSVVWLSVFLFFSVVVPLVVSITVNGAVEYTATIFRVLSYFIFMYLVWALSRCGYLKFKDIYNVFVVLVLICGVVGAWQVFTGGLVNMNGADRLSSLYGGNPAGFALLMLLTSSFFWGCFLSESVNVSKLHSFIFFSGSSIMMFLTHSRQALLTLFLLMFFFMWLRGSKLQKIVVVLALLFVSYSLFWVVMNTNLAPRMALLLEHGFSDGSSQTRFSIIENSLSNLTGIDRYVGVGLGGFNHFYGDLSGKLGVAAHNDYLLFYVEGGVLSFVCFVLMTFYGLFYFLVRAIKNDFFYVPLAVFLSISFLSFLNNPLYYAQTQVLAFSIYGFFISKKGDVHERLY